jgi:hypothetical protein
MNDLLSTPKQETCKPDKSMFTTNLLPYESKPESAFGTSLLVGKMWVAFDR